MLHGRRLHPIATGGCAGRGDPAGGSPRHRALRHTHHDVLDEPADDRRVVADLRDPETGFGRDALEMRNVAQRIEVVRLAKVLLPQVDEVPALQLFRGLVDPFQAGGNRRVLAHVRVDEERRLPASDAVRFREHPVQRVGREMLEDVERPRLVERIVGKRQLAQVAEQQVDLPPRVAARKTG